MIHDTSGTCQSGVCKAAVCTPLVVHVKQCGISRKEEPYFIIEIFMLYSSNIVNVMLQHCNIEQSEVLLAELRGVLKLI